MFIISLPLSPSSALPYLVMLQKLKSFFTWKFKFPTPGTVDSQMPVGEGRVEALSWSAQYCTSSSLFYKMARKIKNTFRRLKVSVIKHDLQLEQV